METAYDLNRYPTKTDREAFAKECGITAKQVDKWFDKRRAKDMKEELKTRNKRLEAAYDRNRYPTETDREAIAIQCGITAKQVDNWFNKRRWKDKKIKVIPEQQDDADDRHLDGAGVDE